MKQRKTSRLDSKRAPFEFWIDRSEWPKGPWDGEPDRVEWRDEASGLPCLIGRQGFGHLCGYVGVYPKHPFYGKHYDDSDLDDLSVHGGLTYSAVCHGLVRHSPSQDERGVWWFGFDCAHADDMIPRFTRVFSRDAAESVERVKYRTIKYVTAECSNLARQLAATSR